MISVRKLTAEDFELVKDWMSQDEFHQQLGLTPEMVYEPNTEACIIFDETGPIQIVRFHKALRAAVQFNPVAKYRNAKAGAEVAAWFKQIAAESGMKEVIIRPGGKAIKFVEKLGFKEFIGKSINSGV